MNSKDIIQFSLDMAEGKIYTNTVIYLDDKEFSEFNQALITASQNITEENRNNLRHLLTKKKIWE